MKRIAVVGAGGFAREVAWLLAEINHEDPQFEFAGFIVSDLGRLSDRDDQDRILGDFSALEHARLDALAMGIGTPAHRLRLGRELQQSYPQLEWPALIHPTVRWDAGSCHLGQGVLLCAGVLATVGIQLHEFALVNLACTLGHEAVVGAGSVLNPDVNLSGGAVVGESVLVGTGAQILQYVRLGDGAVVGAGAVVHRNVNEKETVVGIPARPLQRKS